MRQYKHQNQQKESEADTQLMNNETKDLEVFKIHSKTESWPQKLPIFFRECRSQLPHSRH